MDFDSKLKELNIDLPKAADPVGSYTAIKIVNKLLILIISVFLLSSCETMSNKTQNLKKPGDKCPPQNERTLADIFCREKYIK